MTMRSLGFLSAVFAWAIIPMACAADGRLPSWILGDWTVVKVHEDDIPYPEPAREPQVWLSGQTLTVSPEQLSLAGEICVKFEAVTKRGDWHAVLADVLGKAPEQIGVRLSKAPRDYVHISCGQSFTEGTIERPAAPRMDWEILAKSKDRIEMPFFGGAYLELRRSAPTS